MPSVVTTPNPAVTCSEPLDDRSLLQRLQAGDQQAFVDVVRSHGGRMLSVARRLLGNDEDARDAVQSAFLSAFRALGSFHGDAQLSTWLHRIVVNAALMTLRSRRRKPEEPLTPLLPRFDDNGHHVEPTSSWVLPDEALIREETRARVRAAIERLPERYRMVLVLRDVEELSTEEVARLLGGTPNAIKIRLHRARQALATLLRADAPAPRVAGHPPRAAASSRGRDAVMVA